MRITFERQHIMAPFPEPDGFVFPLVPPRRPTARRRTTLLEQLGAPRPEKRRMAVMILGGLMDDPAVSDAIRASSSEDPDPYVRGLALMCLGVATSESVESLIVGAQRLVAEAPAEKRGSRASDLAWEAAGYGILGAVSAAVRTGRTDMAGELRRITELLDATPSSDWRDSPGRRQSAVMLILADLERPRSTG